MLFTFHMYESQNQIEIAFSENGWKKTYNFFLFI